MSFLIFIQPSQVPDRGIKVRHQARAFRQPGRLRLK
jgi:hypothetical protein